MKILVTGVAGFIGFHLASRLLKEGNNVVGIDSLNDYYDPKLKKLRLEKLKEDSSLDNFVFEKIDIAERETIDNFFKNNKFDAIVHLAAQAGVRYSLENPNAYIDSNIVGFTNILEGCRSTNIGHFIFASSSSVYGMNIKQPFSTDDKTDFPVSLYAATKKSNELIAHTYSHLYNIPTTGLRFFTVYGPYGRPDMAYFKFTKAILEQEAIDVYNNGDMKRDFTYIDDIVEGICTAIAKIPSKQENVLSNSSPKYQIYNLGNNNPVTLKEFIESIEKACEKKALQNLLPIQAGDVPITYADIDKSIQDLEFQPTTNIEEGIKKFVDWYKKYNS